MDEHQKCRPGLSSLRRLYVCMCKENKKSDAVASTGDTVCDVPVLYPAAIAAKFPTPLYSGKFLAGK